MSANQEYEFADNVQTDDRVQGGDTIDNSYATTEPNVPVTKDEDPVEQPNDEIDPNSEEALERDERDAMNKDNIIKDRTRHAAPKGGYREPGDEEGLPSDTGVSSTR